jgi:hypothetical protein
MAGYTPLFSSLTTGTLYGRWPDIGLWTIVLALADKNGVVDVTPNYLAGVTGLPATEIIACMKRFCEPDPQSRSRMENGARLVLIDSTRDWGWIVVNHAHYREKARKQAQQSEATESGRDAERKRIARERAASGGVQSCPAKSSDYRPSDSDSDSDSDKEKKRTKNPDRAAAQPEPGEFVELRRDYPKRAGSQRWHDALGAYRARVGEGTEPKAILAGVRRYAAFIRATGKERTEHVQQAATFLGKNRGFELPWTPPAKPETAGDRLMRTLNGDDSEALEHESEYARLPGH